jgi:hypothetical protein
VFQQDGSPAHTAKKTIDWLDEVCNVLRDWPPNSPDLSPIELSWAILKKVVAVLNPQTLEELKTALETAWDGIPPETTDKLCKSFKRRLIMCSERGGQSISNDLWIACERECMPESDSDHQGDNRVWSPEEDAKIIELRLLLRSNWARMSPMLDNRTALHIKNRWHSVLKKREEKGIWDLEKQLMMRRNAQERYQALLGAGMRR